MTGEANRGTRTPSFCIGSTVKPGLSAQHEDLALAILLAKQKFRERSRKPLIDVGLPNKEKSAPFLSEPLSALGFADLPEVFGRPNRLKGISAGCSALVFRCFENSAYSQKTV